MKKLIKFFSRKRKVQKYETATNQKLPTNKFSKYSFVILFAILSFTAKAQDSVKIDTIYAKVLPVRSQIVTKNGRVMKTFRIHNIHVKGGQYYSYSNGWYQINGKWFTKQMVSK